jgi:hypothetical protein
LTNLPHFADVVFAEPGRCWRMIQATGAGSSDHCPEPVVWVGDYHLAGGEQVRVWSCDGHRVGLEEPESVEHR